MSDIKKVDFLHSRHKKLWEILSEWEGEDTEDHFRQQVMSVVRHGKTIDDFGYISGSGSDTFICGIVGRPEVYGREPVPCTRCPLAWTDRDGNPAKDCSSIIYSWLASYGEDKKRLARMIMNMPLKEDAELVYNIVE